MAPKFKLQQRAAAAANGKSKSGGGGKSNTAANGEPRSSRPHKPTKQMRKHGKVAIAAAEALELKELARRVTEEAPPIGSNPLAEDFAAGTNKRTKIDAYGNSESPAAAADSKSNGNDSKSDATAAATASAAGPAGAAKQHKLFSALPISKRTQNALRDDKKTVMTDIQRAAIPHALAGRDVLGAARTGSGKTLAFLIPTVEKLYRMGWDSALGLAALIISPTRELALQIFDVLKVLGAAHNYPAGLLIGGKPFED